MAEEKISINRRSGGRCILVTLTGINGSWKMHITYTYLKSETLANSPQFEGQCHVFLFPD